MGDFYSIAMGGGVYEMGERKRERVCGMWCGVA